MLHLSFCTRDRVSDQSGVSAMDTGVSVPPRVKINLSIIMMRLNRMLMIKTHNEGHDEDENRDYCQVASNSYSMKPTLVAWNSVPFLKMLCLLLSHFVDKAK